MDDKQKIPLLYTFYFGENAASAQRSASRRLAKWSNAFDAWIDLRSRQVSKNAVYMCVISWRRLARQQQGKMPWEITAGDIHQHIDWMKAQGLSRSSITYALGSFTSFYAWCDERGVDKGCGKGFNPAKEVGKNRMGPFECTCMLSGKEVEALLGLFSRDEQTTGEG